MQIRGLTHREKVSRKKTLNALRALRMERAKGMGKRAAAISALEASQRALTGVSGKPFLTEPEKRVMKRLNRAVLPGKATGLKRAVIKRVRKVFVRKKYYEKHGLIKRLFREGPELGILMVKPEIYSEWHKVNAFLWRIKYIYCHAVFDETFSKSFLSGTHSGASPVSCLTVRRCHANRNKTT